MPSVLIAGCGYVGQATADRFHQAGWKVEGWTARPETASELRRPYVVKAVDITDAPQVADQKRDFDAVVHCASTRGGDAELYRRVYLQGARNLLGRFGGSTIVFASSTSVYAQRNGEQVTEESPANPEHENGKVLREAEEIVLANRGIVARLAGIYGPGRSALVKRFLEGSAAIDPEHDRFVNQVHRDDIAAALFVLLDRQPRPAGIFNVVDNEPLRQSECYRWLAGKLNRPLPRPVAESTLERKRGRSNKRVSNAKLRGLNWSPLFPTFREAMEKSILASFAESGFRP